MLSSNILKKVKQIEIQTRRMVNDLFSGEYHSAFKGRGMEFAEVREYQYGDDVRLIDWNVTARHRSPFIKVMEEERELTVFFLIDVSRSGRFGSSHRLKSEVAAEVCSVLAFSAINNGDKVGLLSYSDQVERYIPPRKGKSYAMQIIREVLSSDHESAGTDLRAGLEFLHRVLRKKSVIFVISDFYERDFERELRALGNKHDVILINMVDPLDMVIPNLGVMTIHDAENGEEMLMDTTDAVIRQQYAAQFIQRQSELEQIARINKMDLINLFTHQPYVKPLAQFFKNRGRIFH